MSFSWEAAIIVLTILNIAAAISLHRERQANDKEFGKGWRKKHKNYF